MHLAAIVHMFDHSSRRHCHRAGAEVHLKHLLRAWVKAGHSAKVVVMRGDAPPCFLDGIEVVAGSGKDCRHFADADGFITHLDFSPQAMDLSEYWRIPLIHLVHNHISFDVFKLGRRGDLYVYAASWLFRLAQGRLEGRRAVVCNPIVFPNDIPGRAGLGEKDCVLLVGLNENKGGDILPAIAGAMPDVRFVAVCNAYDDQMIQAARECSNVEVYPSQPDMSGFYRRARVVIMPSVYESFGIVAAEAMHCHVPVVCSATPGLLECVEDGGQFVPLDKRDYSDYWTTPLRALMTDDDHWRHWRNRARIRSAELQAIARRDERDIVGHLENCVRANRQRGGVSVDFAEIVRAAVRAELEKGELPDVCRSDGLPAGV